jgi:hypothetical protein
MAFVLKDRVRESSITTGTGAIALAGAVGGYQRFSAIMSIGDTCWYSIVLPGSAWETGIGTYSALNTLTRTTVLESSNAGAAVSFAAGTKDVYITLPASKGNAQNNAFVTGTLMTFQQTSAPTYWTKQVTHNDKALRVVSGAAGVGGTYAFSTVHGQLTTQNHTNTAAESPSHTHPYNDNGGISICQDHIVNNAKIFTNSTGNTGSIGGDQPHNHSILMDVLYVDLIIASKD